MLIRSCKLICTDFLCNLIVKKIVRLLNCGFTSSPKKNWSHRKLSKRKTLFFVSMWLPRSSVLCQIPEWRSHLPFGGSLKSCVITAYMLGWISLFVNMSLNLWMVAAIYWDHYSEDTQDCICLTDVRCA